MKYGDINPLRQFENHRRHPQPNRKNIFTLLHHRQKYKNIIVVIIGTTHSCRIAPFINGVLQIILVEVTLLLCLLILLA